MQESYRQALGGIYPVPVLFFAKALYLAWAKDVSHKRKKEQNR